MRPIIWGTIWFVIGMIGWVTFSVFAGICEVTTPGKCGLLTLLVYFFGLLFFFSLPIAILVELMQFFKKRKDE